MRDFTTLEDAVKKAKEFNALYNECEEFTDAYYIYYNDGTDEPSIGGDCGVIVEKRGGNVLKWAQYFLDGKRDIVSTGKITKC